MKFIVDAQLPQSLSFFLNESGHDAIHTINLPEKNRSKDNFINKLSFEENRIVITKDSDFLESFLIRKVPSKLILVKTGNIRNEALISIFRKHISKISELMEKGDLIEITKTEITLHI